MKLLSSGSAVALLCTSAITMATLAISGAVATAAEKPAFDTRLIPPDSAAAIVIRPAQILDRPIVKQTLAAARKSLGTKLTEEAARLLGRRYGTPVSNISEVVFLYSQPWLRSFAVAELGIPLTTQPNARRSAREHLKLPATIVRFREAVDEKRILQSFFGKQDFQRMKRTLAGKTYYTRHRLSICLLTPKACIIGPQQVVRRMIAAGNQPSPLAALLQKTEPSHDAVFAMTGASLSELARDVPRDRLPPTMIGLFDALEKTESVFATGRLTGKTLASLTITSANVASAAKLSAALKNTLLPKINGMYRQTVRAAMLKSWGKRIEPTVAILDEVLNAPRIAGAEARVVVEIRRPTSLARLPDGIGPYVDQIKTAFHRTDRKLRLRTIGVAFHNYHDKHRRFPRHGSDHTGKKQGLSWRVHLLPFLGHEKLYKQFKLDEKWDSPHNKKLIGKMPKVFQHPKVKQAGKTAFHVFVGKQTPFGGKGPGSRFSDIIDGTSNTIMVVETGHDRADYWTRPGGIAFNAGEDPVDELGEIDDGFMILLIDGFSRWVSKSIKTETMNRLIQHADGKVISEY